MWMHLTDDKAAARATLDSLSAMLKRDPATLADQVLIGPAEACAAKLAAYADAGVDTVFVWPLRDPVRQLHDFGDQVVPRLR